MLQARQQRTASEPEQNFQAAVDAAGVDAAGAVAAAAAVDSLASASATSACFHQHL